MEGEEKCQAVNCHIPVQLVEHELVNGPAEQTVLQASKVTVVQSFGLVGSPGGWRKLLVKCFRQVARMVHSRVANQKKRGYVCTYSTGATTRVSSGILTRRTNTSAVEAIRTTTRHFRAIWSNADAVAATGRSQTADGDAVEAGAVAGAVASKANTTDV